MRAILIEKGSTGSLSDVKEIDETKLPPGDVSVAIDFSSLNYKDSLAITGRGPIVKQYPMIPGIDFAGTVEQSLHPQYKPGDRVLLNGWGVGEKHWGGFAQKARVKGDWLLPLPTAFTPAQAMMIGTAGYTAMLSVEALAAHGITPSSGEIVVSGATGGVGSLAIILLAQRGYQVVALTGKKHLETYLKDLGATAIIDRYSLPENPRPLEKERWAGVIDNVGGKLLASLCAQCRYHAVVASCGLAGGADFPTTVMPFILRGVTLCGIESVYAPFSIRQRAWDLLAREVSPARLEKMSRFLTLKETLKAADEQLNGALHGRIVVDVNR